MDRWKAIALVLGGMLVGVLFAGPGPSMADSHSKFKECAFSQGHLKSVKEASKLEETAKPVPEGWTVVGTSAGPGFLGVLFCR